MSDKELIEKVAEKNEPTKNLDIACKVARNLGYVAAGTYLSCECVNVEYPHAPHQDTGQEIFSWPTFGLMVENAERRGWYLNKICDQYSFKRFEADYKHTSLYMANEHGHIMACALAYVEIENV